VVVATATKALQEQLLTKDVPAAAAALGGRPWSPCSRAARTTCAARAFRASTSSAGSSARGGRSRLRALRDWIETTETGDRAELEFEPSRRSGRSFGRRRPLLRPPLPALGSCLRGARRERAGEAELVIANHALYFADLALRTARRRRGPARARRGRLRRGAPLEEPRLRGSAGASRSRASAARARRRALCREESRTPPARASPRSIGRRASRRRVRPRLRAAPPDCAPTSRSSRSTARPRRWPRAASPRALARGEEGDALVRRALARRGRRRELHGTRRSRPRLVGRAGRSRLGAGRRLGILRESLWDSETTRSPRLRDARPALRPPPARARRRARARPPSPFDYRDQALVYVPPRCPSPRSPGYYDRLADEIVALCRSPPGARSS
jgi:ATP-dependent DNA helicase DinG